MAACYDKDVINVTAPRIYILYYMRFSIHVCSKLSSCSLRFTTLDSRMAANNTMLILQYELCVCSVDFGIKTGEREDSLGV